MVLRRFLCFHEGWCRKGSGGGIGKGKKTRNVQEFKCGCPSFIRINLFAESSEWMVGAFNDDHNHAFITPSKRWYLRTK